MKINNLFDDSHVNGSKEIVIAVYRPCGCEIHACVDNIEEVKNNFPTRCKFHIESTHQETGGYSLGLDW